MPFSRGDICYNFKRKSELILRFTNFLPWIGPIPVGDFFTPLKFKAPNDYGSSFAWDYSTDLTAGGLKMSGNQGNQGES